MSKTRKRDRIFVLVMAIAFVIPTIGVSIGLIYQIVKENKASNSTTPTTQTTQSNKLKGKQMDNFTPVAKVDSLQITDLQQGTGDEVKAGATVTVDYTGALASNGTIFESSLDSGQQATFGLNQVIAGWRDGLVGMKVGGKRRLLIPAAQAYGAQSRPGIPANSDLVFDITLHSVQQ